MKLYAVVYWEEEKAYSTVNLKKVDIGNLPLDQVVKKSFPIEWGSGTIYGVIEAYGKKVEMTVLEKKLAQDAANTSFSEKEHHGDLINLDLQLSPLKRAVDSEIAEDFRAKRAKPRRQLLVCAPGSGSMEGGDINLTMVTSQSERSVTPTPVDNLPIILDEGGAGADDQPFEREDQIKEQSLISKLQEENLLLKKQLKKYSKVLKQHTTSTEDEENVEVSPGIFLNSSLVELAKISYRSKPSIFLRKLLFCGKVLTLEEIAASSLTGKPSTLSPEITRPALDPRRFGALKEFVIKCCGLQPKTMEMLDFEQKIRGIPSDARRRLIKVDKKK